MEQFWTILWGIIGTIGAGLATWLTTVIVGWLNSKIKDQKLAKWSTAVTTIIFNAVQTVFQEFVDTMKKAGKFDAEAAKEAKERAYKIITGELTEDLRKYIEDNFGDMKEWIMNQIESAIYQLKK